MYFQGELTQDYFQSNAVNSHYSITLMIVSKFLLCCCFSVDDD